MLTEEMLAANAALSGLLVAADAVSDFDVKGFTFCVEYDGNSLSMSYS